jgi:two-component system, OmpR family, alkaline phosphatase synthesis response regulator PhoP
MPATAHILVVDDDLEIVRLLRAYLEQASYQVSVAHDGETALHMLRQERPNLMILDLMLPDRDGWDITRTVRSDSVLKNIPIIMLTARIEDTDKIIGLDLGADDYITKPFNPREVVSRVRAVLRRMQVDTASDAAEILECGAIHMDVAQRKVSVNHQDVELTPTEFELLRTLMENPGFVFTRSTLIERSLGFDYESLERTLDTHIKNLRKKIEPNPREPTYIQTIYGVGYRMEKVAS